MCSRATFCLRLTSAFYFSTVNLFRLCGRTSRTTSSHRHNNGDASARSNSGTQFPDRPSCNSLQGKAMVELASSGPTRSSDTGDNNNTSGALSTTAFRSQPASLLQPRFSRCANQDNYDRVNCQGPLTSRWEEVSKPWSLEESAIKM